MMGIWTSYKLSSKDKQIELVNELIKRKQERGLEYDKWRCFTVAKRWMDMYYDDVFISERIKARSK